MDRFLCHGYTNCTGPMEATKPFHTHIVPQHKTCCEEFVDSNTNIFIENIMSGRNATTGTFFPATHSRKDDTISAEEYQCQETVAALAPTEPEDLHHMHWSWS